MDHTVAGVPVSFTEDYSFTRTLGRLTLRVDIQTMHTRLQELNKSQLRKWSSKNKDGWPGLPAHESWD